MDLLLFSKKKKRKITSSPLSTSSTYSVLQPILLVICLSIRPAQKSVAVCVFLIDWLLLHDTFHGESHT
jgi:hypothetical protein